jgi:hypothetical protein
MCYYFNDLAHAWTNVPLFTARGVCLIVRNRAMYRMCHYLHVVARAWQNVPLFTVSGACFIMGKNHM